MADGSLTDLERQNQEVLGELCRLLRFSQGEFGLIIAVCNSSQHRQVLVTQLRQQCSVAFEELTLDPAVDTLFTTIRDALGDSPPEALMVYGLGNVQNLDQVLTATNQIREEFRQFPFPLVLWLSDDGLKHLMRTAPDFYTWANPVTFETPPEFFLEFLDDLIRDVFQHIERSQENYFLSNQALGLTPGSPRCREFEISVALLGSQNQLHISPAQAAGLEFVRGRIADNYSDTAREHYEQSLAQWQARLEQHGSETHSDWQKNLGYVQFYLGLWWGNYAIRHQREFQTACETAQNYFAAAVQTFEAAQRSDLASKTINYQALTLHRLGRWDELETVATKALTLHQQQNAPFRAARAEGYLAEVALARSDWSTAQRHAETALELIEPTATVEPNTLAAEDQEFYAWVNSFHRSWYLFSLGKAQIGQGQVDLSVQTLQQIETLAQPEYDPLLYTRALNYLYQGYFEQGQYLKAFETRRRKEAIETRFNFRAFIGAGRLQPKRRVINPAMLGTEGHQDLIVASGRKHDVKALVNRLARDEYTLTIVHGPSGVGKSSLIEAGLVPVLEQERFESRQVVPVLLQRYGDWLKDLAKAFGWEVPTFGDEPDADQAADAQSISSSGLAERWLLEKMRELTQRNRILVLIFDQFEEFFFAYDQTADRRRFYDFWRDCLAMPFVKVVLSLREDYIHYLLECNRLTDLGIIDNNILDKKWLYYLGNFTLAEAETVIKELTQPTAYNPDAEMVQQVVLDLAAGAGEVRPIELQIVGTQLQENRIMTLTAYQHRSMMDSSPKEALVRQYLVDIVRECGPEQNQQLAEIVLFLLTDEKGTRPLKTALELMADLRTLTNRTQIDVDGFELVLQILVKAGLVIQVPEKLDDRYQLVHDYLAAFIRSSQQPLMAQLEHERQKRKQEEQKRIEAERKQLRQARQASMGLGALAFLAIGAGSIAWAQRENAIKGEVNAQFVADSLAMEAYLNSGLEQNAVAQAVLAGQRLQNIPKRQLETGTRLRVISAIREVIYEVKERERLIGHSAAVSSVAFSPDGETIATASSDNTVKLWSAEGEELQTLDGHSDEVWSVVFSPDGKTIATASLDKTVKLWSTEGEELQTLSGHNNGVFSVAFSPDGETIATASLDKTVKLWSTEGEELQTLSGHNNGVSSVAFSPDGEMIATASGDTTVKLWSAEGEELQTLNGHTSAVWSVVFSPDGETIATASGDDTLKLWSAEGEELQTLNGHSDRITSVAFSPDGETIATAGWDNTVKLWSAEGEELQTLNGHGDAVSSVTFSPDGETIATASWDNTVKLWSTAGEEVQTLNGHSDGVSSVAFSPDGETIATASRDNTVKLWSTAGEELKTLSGHSDEVWSVVFSPDGKTIATASWDKTVKLWSAEGKKLQTLDSHSDGVLSVAFSPDGETIATASLDKTVKLWSAEGKELQTLNGHSDSVSSVTFSPDGETIATASWDKTVKLWNAEGEELQTLNGHSVQVYSVAFSPDGETIATASWDKTVKLWSTEGEELQTLNSHSAAVLSAAFSPDGETIATVSWDKTVKLWNFKLDELVTTGCDWLGTYFTKQTPQLLVDLEVCQGLDPSLTTVAAPILAKQAKDLARDGNVKRAIELLRQATVWNKSLDVQPQITANNLANASKIIAEAEEMAQQGQVAQVTDLLAQAKQLDLELDFVPELRAKELVIEAYLREADIFLQNGDVERAVKNYRQAEAVGLEDAVTAVHWNNLCWEGSLHNQAKKVMFACQKAVSLEPKDGDIIDSRGLARALTGDTQGALSDFKTFIEWTLNEEYRAERQAWVNALEKGENPFTDQVLEDLRND